MALKSFACVLLLSVLTVACGPVAPPTDATSVAGLEARIQGIEADVTRLQLQDSLRRGRAVAILDLQDAAYEPIETAHGKVFLSVRNVAAHLDGVRVMLRVGNPNFVTFNGLTISATWGPRMPAFDSADFNAAHAAWEAQLKSKDSTVTSVLRPGTWTDVSLTLSPATTETLGFLRIDELAFDNVELRVAN